MRKFILALFAPALAVVFLAHLFGSANAATLTPKAATCAAFAQWNHHRTTANLDRMVTASLPAPWHNLGNDVNVVYADVRGGNHTDLAGDVTGIASDCR